MSGTMKLADILFKHRQSSIEICPGCMTNSYCPAGTSASPRRPGSKLSTGGPKYSRLSASLKHIFIDRSVSALVSDNKKQLYCEIVGSAGVQAYLYDDESLTLAATEATDITIPMLLFALESDDDTFQYVRKAAQDVCTSYDAATQTVASNALGYLDECFYYDWKEKLKLHDGTLEVKEFGASDLQSVKQSIRVGAMGQTSNCLYPILSPTFNKVSFDASSNPRATAAAHSEYFDKAKAGDFIVGYDWSAAQQSRIRPLSSLEDYIPNESYRKMVMLTNKRLQRVVAREMSGATSLDAIKSDYVNIILGGRPGTGKTTTAHALSAALGLPIYTTTVTRNTEEDTFEGMTKANSDGKFLLHNTAFLDAFMHGGIVVLEEFNLADPGVMQGAIGQAIEYPFILHRDGYEEVHRHPMCVIIATMNTGTQGAREPNQALTSRLPITLTMNDPTENEFLQILQSHGHKKTLCKKVYKAYKSILTYLKETANNEEMALCVTMRHCLAALDLLDDEIVENIRDAIYDTMIGSIGLRDMELAEDTFKHAIEPLSL